MTDLSQEILALARERGRVTVRAICALMGTNRKTLKVHLRGLVERKLLVLDGKSKGAWYHA